jgi:hypothetical protein
MRKEVLFAILAGTVIGVVIAFGVWRANSALKVKDSKPPSPTTAPESETPQQEFGITLAKPEELDVITQTPLTLSGITKPDVWITISGEDEDYITKSDEPGAFELNVELIGGVNQILITAFDDDGKAVEETLTVVYSTEFAKKTKEVSETTSKEEATQEAEAVAEKVQQKIEEARNKPKAYLGTITDIAENTIQIKSIAGEILQVSVTQATSFVKVGKTKQAIKYEDAAIGDFMVAMGFRGTNDVLNAERVLLTTAPEPLKRRAVLGDITKAKLGEVTLTPSLGDEFVIKPAKNIRVTVTEGEEISIIKFSNIEEGARIIVVGAVEDETFTARTIHVISQPPTPTPEE